MTYPSVALLVDGDNIPSSHAERILREAISIGELAICRTYVDTAHVSDWETSPSFRLIHSGTGKNSTDILLCIDAMDIAHSDAITHFVIASGDRDFRHLAHRLRERGKRIIGIGPVNADERFRCACTDFRTIGEPTSDGIDSGHGEPPNSPAANQEDIQSKLQKVESVILNHGKDRCRITLSQLGIKMSSTYSIAKEDLPIRQWSRFIKKYSTTLEVDGNEVALITTET